MKTHFILYVADQARSTAFYSAVLGAEPALDVPGMTEFTFSENCILGLMREAGIRALLGERLPDPSRANGTPRAELYLVVPSPALFHERALSAGGTELSALALRNWGYVVSYCLDPDGHVIAFATEAR